MAWTTADLPDLTGHAAVVTGANSGIGLVTATELARAGATVVLACRDPERGADALRGLRAEVPGADAELVELDLGDLASVRTAAAEIAARLPKLDLLINNAGVMALPLRYTTDGFESQFGIDHLGHFALTGLLLPELLARPGARVVTVSSVMHHFGSIDLTNLNAERGYHPWSAYQQAKLANLLFTAELQRRADLAAVDLRSVAAHPGYARTNLQTAGPRMAGARVTGRVWSGLTTLVGQSAAAGALPTLRAATDPGVTGGAFLGPRWFAWRGAPVPAGRSRAARDLATAKALWDRSAELTGVDYAALGS